MKIPPDWKDNLIDAYIDYSCYQYNSKSDKIVIVLKGRYIVKKLFKTDGILEKTLYTTEDIFKTNLTLKELKKTDAWKRVEVLWRSLMDKQEENELADWRKRATEALVSSDMTEKDKFISDWLEEFEK